MKRVINKINEVLKTRKSIGYIEICYNGETIGHFATKECLQDEGIETTDGMILFEKNYLGSIKKVVRKIVEAKGTRIYGDYYGDGFTGWLIEGINFCEE